MEPATMSLRPLGLASLIEGSTLLLLLLVGVPLKHGLGYPQAAAVLGPLHGLAFVAYLWAVLHTAGASGWPGGKTARLLLAALVPGGTFFTWRGLRRQQPNGSSAC